MSKFVAVLVLIFIVPGSCMLGTHPRVGWFPESNFELSPESRFPGWFFNQQGHDRSKVTVWIYYYAPPFGPTNFKAELVELGSERRVLESKYGESKWHPITKQNLDSGVDHYPSFHVVNVEGLKELVEHRKMEPIFYISDDGEMKKSAFVHK